MVSGGSGGGSVVYADDQLHILCFTIIAQITLPTAQIVHCCTLKNALRAGHSATTMIDFQHHDQWLIDQ